MFPSSGLGNMRKVLIFHRRHVCTLPMAAFQPISGVQAQLRGPGLSVLSSKWVWCLLWHRAL